MVDFNPDYLPWPIKLVGGILMLALFFGGVLVIILGLIAQVWSAWHAGDEYDDY